MCGNSFSLASSPPTIKGVSVIPHSFFSTSPAPINNTGSLSVLYTYLPYSLHSIETKQIQSKQTDIKLTFMSFLLCLLLKPTLRG